MTNKEIAGRFKLLADILELLEANPFKVKSYRNAYNTLRRLDTEVKDMEQDEIESLQGVGKAICSKIGELVEHGEMSALKNAKAEVPEGVIEMLKIKGLGPSRIRKLWKGLEVNSPGELLYACEENRLVGLSGFGEKSQSDIRKKIQFYLSQRGHYFFHEAEEIATGIIRLLEKNFPSKQVVVTGELRRLNPTVSSIEILTNVEIEELAEAKIPHLELLNARDNSLLFAYREKYEATLHCTTDEQFNWDLLRTTGPDEFIKNHFSKVEKTNNQSAEKNLFEKVQMKFILPEHRDWETPNDASEIDESQLIDESDIKGVVHAHSTYSDGLNSLEEMAIACKERGYEYLAITDHSRYAFYANGMPEERVYKQWEEIDELNKKMAPFRIIKGIEADILPDGHLDYVPEFIEKFELVIASVHSVLGMDEKKATNRLIKAIENPATDILGHPTGRLLLSREGYPLDMEKILDACANNGVSVEINANPHRLDLDWRWVWTAMEKGVKLNINPDAHSIAGIADISHGVRTARKGGLLKNYCLNTEGASDFLEHTRRK